MYRTTLSGLLTDSTSTGLRCVLRNSSGSTLSHAVAHFASLMQFLPEEYPGFTCRRM
jgi:hypothetical protein